MDGELSNMRIMTSEEYKKYLLNKMKIDPAVKESLLHRFDFTKERLMKNYGKESFAVIADTENALPEKSTITVAGLPFYVIDPRIVMVSKSIRDVKLYEEEDLEEFNGEDVFEFLNWKLEDLMAKHLYAMNPEVDAEHVHAE